MKSTVDYVWRLIGTGISYSSFGIGGLLLATTLFPAFNVFVRDHKRRSDLAQQTIHLAFRLFVRGMVALRVIDFEPVGADKLKEDVGVLIVANHPSLIDVVLLMSLMQRAQCIVKHQIWHNLFIGGVVKAANYIRNDDDPENLVADCQAELAKGNNLIIFPEGTRSVPGKPRRLQRGFAHVAIRTGAPIRLATVSCAPPTLLKGQKWYQIPPRRPRFTVRIHDRIEIPDLPPDKAPSVAVRQLTQYTLMRWEELLGYERVGA